MNLLDLLKGKTMSVMTDMNVPVELVIESVEENRHSRDLEPSTAANDWWPAQETWTNYTVKFTNGSKKIYRNLSEIKILD